MTRACGMRRTRRAAVAPPQTSPPHLPATSWRRVRGEHDTLRGSACHCLQSPSPPRPRPAPVAAPLLAARACTHVLPYHNFISAGPHESLLRVSTVSEGVTASPLCPLRTAPSASCGRVQRTLGLNQRPSQCQGCRCRRRVERTHCGNADVASSARHDIRKSHSASAHTAAAISTCTSPWRVAVWRSPILRSRRSHQQGSASPCATPFASTRSPSPSVRRPSAQPLARRRQV